MSFRLSFLILFLFFNLFSSQENDTIVVYEEVIIHDTIYVKDKTPQNIPLDNKFPTKTEKQSNTDFQYGISIIAGNKNTNFFQSSNQENNWGFGGGIWVMKSFANNLISFSLSGNYLKWLKTFEIDANKTDSELNGYYFTELNEPVLFQKLNNENSEIIIPLKVYFNFLQNFSPYFGVFGNYTTFKMEFLVPENNVLNKKSDFIAHNSSLGWIGGLQYNIKKWSIFVEYQQNDFQDLEFESSDTGNLIFQFKNGFKNKKILLGINYAFSK